jgi:PAS domain-containing protein
VSKIGSEDESADDDHLLELNDILEPLPDSWLKEKWPRAGKFFGPNRERLNPYSEEDAEAEEMDDIDSEEMDDTGAEEMDNTDSKELEEAHQEEEEECDDGDDKMQDGIWINDSLEKLFEKNKPEDIDEAEAEVVTALIRQILKYEPSQRPSALELLQHPWFRD